MFKKLSETLNKSINNFISQSNDLDESRIPPSGTVTLPVEKDLCKSCKGKGCCVICHTTPCTPLIKCSGKKCKNWVHFNCDALVGDEGDMVDIYYCPPCRKRYPKSRGQITYFDVTNNSFLLDQSNVNSIVKNTVEDMIDIIATLNNAIDVTVINSECSIEKLDYLFDESFDASLSSESLSSALNSSEDSDLSISSVVNSINDGVLRGPAVFESENNDTSKTKNQVPSTDHISDINKINVNCNKGFVSSTPAKQLAEGNVNEKASIDILTEPNITVTMDDSSSSSSYNISLLDIISNFSRELVAKVEENFHLKSRIEALETEKFQGRFVPKEKQELENFRSENLELKNLITNLTINVKNLEEREESTLERLRLAHEEIEHLRSGLDELNRQLYLKPDHVHTKYKAMLSFKDKQLEDLRNNNTNLKNALNIVNKEKTTLAKNIKDLSDSCINKKLLSIALEENDSLHKQIELSQSKIHEAKPPGEMELIRLKDEIAYFKQHTKELEIQVSKYQQKESRPLPTPKNSPKKDTQQTRIFESSNAYLNRNPSDNHQTYQKQSNNHQTYEPRGPCRYFPNCKWGDRCKWDHSNVNKKPRKFNSIPYNQLRTPHIPYSQPQLNHEIHPGPQQPVHVFTDVSKPPPPYSHQNPSYQSGNPTEMNRSLPYVVSATFTPQNSVNNSKFVDNCNLINVPLVPCQNLYNM